MEKTKIVGNVTVITKGNSKRYEEALKKFFKEVEKEKRKCLTE